MIADIWLRSLVTALFLVSASQCIYALVTARQDRTLANQISRLLHLVMAVAMLVMAWPAGMAVPNRPPMVFFLLAAGWFAVLLVLRTGHRVADGYHAVMMLAMAWMYAVMDGQVVPGQCAGTAADAPQPSSSMPSMPGMDMSGPAAHSGAMGGCGHPSAWVSAVNWVITALFGVAALCWGIRYFTVRQDRPDAPARLWFAVVCQATAAAGMAIMFGVLV
ncbi:DUF5134 domain-containing protein [Mycolicibacterium sp. CBMA 226]|uniref:DUF5134 domain-containing protein n=1 Tax=Mycolicibacterium sp. CBMA 226 TaxID=2606611 RepID=UPI0013071C4F|nr:DUF5134 domain-containing protein [Mycolicibacterium sp. CBMA 226]MUL79505.1 DUF5134 domain-containing protein [Mycolicibacterium sp. CBMA 226]